MDNIKVTEIEFHLYSIYELEDTIIRMADLIKDGYKISQFQENPCTFTRYTGNNSSILDITLRKKL